IDVELVRLLRQDAGGRGTPRKRVDKGDLDVGRCGSCQKRSDQQQTRGGTGACTHGSPPSFAGEVAARVASQQSAPAPCRSSETSMLPGRMPHIKRATI